MRCETPTVPTDFPAMFTEPPPAVVARVPFVWRVASVVPVAYRVHARSLRPTLTHWS